MSLTTLQYRKTHAREYNTYDLSRTVSVENAIKASVAQPHGAAVHSRTSKAVESLALERRRRQLPETTALVSDKARLGLGGVGSDKSAFTRPEWGVSAGG